MSGARPPEPVAAASPPLRRSIGLGLLTLYGVGVMVGAGIYVLAGQVAGQAGLWAPLSFLLAGLVAAPTAVAYGELSARLPEAGGEVAYVREAFGTRLLPLLAGAMIVGGATLSAAAVLQGGVGYLRGLVDVPAPLLIVAVGAALIAVAAVGVLESLALAGLFALAEVGGLLFVAWAGLAGAPSADWVAAATAPPPLALAGLAAGALLAFFAFIGFEDIVNMAEETRDPSRTVPRAIALSLGIATLLYALVAVAAVRAVPPEALAASDRPLALVVERGLGVSSAGLSVIAIFAALNGVLAQIVMAARMIYGAARGAAWLRPLAVVHPRFRTPARATLAVGAGVLAIALSVPLLSLAATSATILLMAFCAMNVALIVLKRRGPPPPGAFAAPGWIPWLGIGTALLALGAPWLT